jgi:Uma2 family endonuclease
MQQQRKRYITPQEYLEIERQAATKSEYLDGEIFAMSGATRSHNVIVRNLSRGLNPRQYGKPCEVYTNDMRVEVSPTGLYTYPDLVVVCGDPQFKDPSEDTLLNPTVIIEVLSKSTASYDRGEKFEQYCRLPSLTDYLLVSQDRAAVEHRTRQVDNTWQLTFYYGLDAVVPLPSIGCELRLSEVYDMVRFPSADAARGQFRIVKEPSEEYEVKRPGSPTY